MPGDPSRLILTSPVVVNHTYVYPAPALLSIPAAPPSDLMTHMSAPVLTLALRQPGRKCFKALDNSWLPVPAAAAVMVP